jgi:hypothetical protein
VDAQNAGRVPAMSADAAAFSKLADDSAALSALSADSGAAFKALGDNASQFRQLASSDASFRNLRFAAELMGRNPALSAFGRNGPALADAALAASKFNSLAALSAMQGQGKLSASMQSALDDNGAAFSAMMGNARAFSALANNQAALSALQRNGPAFAALAKSSNFRALVGNPAFGAALRFGNVSNAINQVD